MALQRDYILRIVEALAQAIARILTLRQAGNAAEARQEIVRTAGSLFGLDLGLIELMGPATVAAQLGHPEKVEALARLVDEKAALEREAGEAAAADKWTRLAAGLRAAVA
jgi:hypothetical protein